MSPDVDVWSEDLLELGFLASAPGALAMKKNSAPINAIHFSILCRNKNAKATRQYSDSRSLRKEGGREGLDNKTGTLPVLISIPMFLNRN